MNAPIKRPCSECGEPTSLRERNGYVLCVACVCAPLDDEPVCECGAPTAKDCECEAEQLEPDNDTNLGLRR